MQIYVLLCRKLLDKEREMKLLLDMYKSAPKESRDKAQVSWQ